MKEEEEEEKKKTVDELVALVNETIGIMKENIDRMQQMKSDALLQVFCDAKEKLGKYDIEDDEKEGIIWTTLEHNGIPFNLEAHLCFKEEDKPYLGFIHVSSKKDHETDEWLKSLFPGDEWKREFDNNKWYCWKYTSYEGVVGEFEGIYKEIQKI